MDLSTNYFGIIDIILYNSLKINQKTRNFINWLFYLKYEIIKFLKYLNILIERFNLNETFCIFAYHRR